VPKVSKNFYITTPIYYVNDSPHIGHAYTTIACDVMARFMKLDGYDVKFLTGTDEHGQKVDKAAKNAGVEPQAFTDEVSKRFLNLVNGGDNILNVTNDDFVRTTEERHKEAAHELWLRINSHGFIYHSVYSGWYSIRDEAFYQESELVNGMAPTGAPVEWTEEESYFFKLSEFQEPLLKFYEQYPDFITPKSRYNEVVSFVKSGLKDLSISRTSFKWGVPVPDDEKHVMYVWIDALTNYLTGVGFPNTEGEDYNKFWLADAEDRKKQNKQHPDYEVGNAVHIVGKDILRFHAVYWPAFLMAAKLPLPRKIVAHGWWTIEGEKMSKSLGNVIAPKNLVDEFGIDQTRYFLMREVPFGNDGNFSREAMRQRINSELANNIGNLAQRTLSMINKNCDGKIPSNSFLKEDKDIITEVNNILSLADVPGTIKACMVLDYYTTGVRFDLAIEQLVEAGRRANLYIDRQQPWALKKDNPERMNTVLYVLAEIIRHIAILLQPFCPQAASNILDQLAVPEDERKFEHLSKKLKPGTLLPKPEGVFPRFEEKKEAS